MKSCSQSATNNVEDSNENVSSTRSSNKVTASTSDSQVPKQKSEDNSDTVFCDVQMGSIPS